MTGLEEAGRIARANVARSLAPGVGFPRNVFAGAWSDYFFFDPDWMTDPGFVEHAKLLLRVDGGACACLLNLERTPDAHDASLLIHEDTTPEAYRTLQLDSLETGTDVPYNLCQLACAADVGDWAIYAEGSNEIAVIGFRHAGGWQRYRPALAQLHAERLETAVVEPFLTWTYEHLLPAWRDEMLRAYAARSA